MRGANVPGTAIANAPLSPTPKPSRSSPTDTSLTPCTTKPKPSSTTKNSPRSPSPSRPSMRGTACRSRRAPNPAPTKRLTLLHLLQRDLPRRPERSTLYVPYTVLAQRAHPVRGKDRSPPASPIRCRELTFCPSALRTLGLTKGSSYADQKSSAATQPYSSQEPSQRPARDPSCTSG